MKEADVFLGLYGDTGKSNGVTSVGSAGCFVFVFVWGFGAIVFSELCMGLVMRGGQQRVVRVVMRKRVRVFIPADCTGECVDCLWSV